MYLDEGEEIISVGQFFDFVKKNPFSFRSIKNLEIKEPPVPKFFNSLKSKRTSDSELLNNFKELVVLMNESGGKELAV
jgi:hypothetical protein